MNIIPSLIICLCTALSSCDFVDRENPDLSRGPHVRDEDYEKIADGITYRVEKKLKTTPGLHCIGTGGGMMNHIRMMAMSFQLFREVDLPEARRILVSVTTEYLKEINDSKRVRPYLKEYPFRVENIEIMIFIRKENNDDVGPNQINYMSANRGLLKYCLPDKPGSYVEQILHEETYEEALKIVREEEKANQANAS